METLKQVIDAKSFLKDYKSTKKKKAFIEQFKTLYSNGKFDEIKQIIEEYVFDEEDEFISGFNNSQLSHSTYNTICNNSHAIISDDRNDRSHINSKSMVNEGNKLKSDIELYNSNYSTKQRLELTTHGNLNSSIRKMAPNTSSPMSKISGSILNEGIKFMKDPKFPFARLAADITLTTKQINKAFLIEMKELGFIVSGTETSEYCKAEKKQFDIFKSFLNCFKLDNSRSSTPNNNSTSLYICTRYSDVNKFERIIEICGTSGKKEIIITAIESFFKKLRTYGKKIRPLRVQDVNSKLLFKNEKSSSSDKLTTVK